MVGAMNRIWRVRGQDLDLGRRGLIMGVLNVTPDSFSDGGQFLAEERAVARGLVMVGEGADILDIGGESTRPGAEPVGAEEELRRVIPVIRSLRSHSEVLISVDTMKAEVAREAMAAGADIINDVNGLRDPAMAEVAANAGAAVVVMHMQGKPRTMQHDPHYEDVVKEVRAFFEERLHRLAEVDIPSERIAFDPGIGFGKTLEQNLTLLRSLERLRAAERPLVLGVSRKSFIGKLLGDMALDKRDWPTVGLTAWMREAGADVVRVHEVRRNAEAMRMVEAIRGSEVAHA